MPKKLTKKVVKLKFPIVVEKDDIERKIEQVVLTRPKLKQLRRFPDSFFENEGKGVSPKDLIPVLSGITNLEEEYVDELDFDDLEQICNTFESFFSKSLRTGKK